MIGSDDRVGGGDGRIYGIVGVQCIDAAVDRGVIKQGTDRVVHEHLGVVLGDRPDTRRRTLLAGFAARQQASDLAVSPMIDDLFDQQELIGRTDYDRLVDALVSLECVERVLQHGLSGKLQELLRRGRAETCSGSRGEYDGDGAARTCSHGWFLEEGRRISACRAVGRQGGDEPDTREGVWIPPG